MVLETQIPSGRRLHFANLKMAIDIVDLPIQNGDFPIVSLPEGNTIVDLPIKNGDVP